jgi:hypothetical protein
MGARSVASIFAGKSIFDQAGVLCQSFHLNKDGVRTLSIYMHAHAIPS